jgi:hypothetical protein
MSEHPRLHGAVEDRPLQPRLPQIGALVIPPVGGGAGLIDATSKDWPKTQDEAQNRTPIPTAARIILIDLPY